MLERLAAEGALEETEPGPGRIRGAVVGLGHTPQVEGFRSGGGQFLAQRPECGVRGVGVPQRRVATSGGIDIEAAISGDQRKTTGDRLPGQVRQH